MGRPNLGESIGAAAFVFEEVLTGLSRTGELVLFGLLLAMFLDGDTLRSGLLRKDFALATAASL